MDAGLNPMRGRAGRVEIMQVQTEPAPPAIPTSYSFLFPPPPPPPPLLSSTPSILIHTTYSAYEYLI